MNASLKKYMITVTEIVISYVKLTASSEENHHAVSISGVCVCNTYNSPFWETNSSGWILQVN